MHGQVHGKMNLKLIHQQQRQQQQQQQQRQQQQQQQQRQLIRIKNQQNSKRMV
jgi:hypothetical protein